MNPGTAIKSEINIKLPLTFIIYALVAFVVAQFVLLLNVDAVVVGQFRSPELWMGAHFLLLGYAVMIVMGAMYQLVPVAFLTSIWSQTFGYYQLGITIVGFTAFTILLGFAPHSAIYGGIVAIIGVLMFLFQMIKTIEKQPEKSIITYFVVGALSAFFLTIIAGFFLAWNLTFGSNGSHDAILQSHIVLGVSGWFTLIIFGFSYKLVPMFSLAHGFSNKWAKRAFITYIIGLLTLIMSFWFHYPALQTIGWFLLLLGFSLFVLDVREILQKRIKKKLDKPFTFALIAILNGLVIHAIALIVHIAGIHNAIIWSWLVFLYIMGWIIFSILGYLYKIVPFLWWTHKFSNKIGQEIRPESDRA